MLDAGTTSAYVMAAIAAVNTVIAAAYYMRVLRVVWMDEAPDGDTSPVKPPAPVVAALAITVIGTIVLGVLPNLVARRASAPSPRLGPRACGSEVADGTDDVARRRPLARRMAAGAIPFERFMELALYGAEGFYTSPMAGSAGRRGDFITSPEVGPLFGAVIARYLDAEWQRIGRPDPFTVVDAGAGPGTLARSVLAATPACRDALRYVAVEVSEAQRAATPTRRRCRLADLPKRARFDGVVIANELLDNLPFRLAVFDNGWREAFVDVGADGRFVERLSAPFDPVPVVLAGVRATFGARAPLIDRAAAFVGDARRLRAAGSARGDRLRHAAHGRVRGSPVARLAAHLSGQRARRPLPRRHPARRTSRSRYRSTSSPSPTPCVRRPSSSALGHRRTRGGGQARLDRAGARGPVSKR